MRDRAVQEIRRQCGVPEERILIAASHTHSGPGVQLMIGFGERDANYLDTLPGKLARVSIQARAAAGPAKVGACRQRIHGIGINRDQPSLGPLDTAAQLLRVDRTDGTPLAVAFNFGAHPVVRYPYTSRISADWPGLVSAYLKVSMPPAIALFLQGCLGNINAHQMTFETKDVGTQQKVCDMRTGDVAMRLGDQLLPGLRATETVPQAELRAL